LYFEEEVRAFVLSRMPQMENSISAIVPGKPKVAPLVAYWENGAGMQ